MLNGCKLRKFSGDMYVLIQYSMYNSISLIIPLSFTSGTGDVNPDSSEVQRLQKTP